MNKKENNNNNKDKNKDRNFKNYSLTAQVDVQNNSTYIFLPPNLSKNPMKPKNTELIKGQFGYLHLDYNEDNKIIGIEILNADKNFYILN